MAFRDACPSRSARRARPARPEIEPPASLCWTSRHVNEKIVGANALECVAVLAAKLVQGEPIEDRGDAERRQNVRCDLETEMAPDRPRSDGTRVAEIDFPAHDHMDGLVGRRKPLDLEAGGILRIGIPRRVDVNALAGALQIGQPVSL